MPLAIWFWVIFVLTVFAGLWSVYTPPEQPYPRRIFYFMLFIIIGILGWAVFGSAVK